MMKTGLSQAKTGESRPVGDAMSNIGDFSFAEDKGDCEVHYEYGDEGGPVIMVAWKDIADMDRYQARADQARPDGTNGNPEGQNGTENNQTVQNGESKINAVLSAAAGHYVQGNGEGSLDLVDYGNGSYALVNIHIHYMVKVGEFPNTEWEERDWHGSSGMLGEGHGGRSDGGAGCGRMTRNAKT